MTEVHYIAVKASLYSLETKVFGVTKEEVAALSKKFNLPENPILPNGIFIQEDAFSVINVLGELGYRVLCSSGENETVWTLCREKLKEPLRQSSGVVRKSVKEVERRSFAQDASSPIYTKLTERDYQRPLEASRQPQPAIRIIEPPPRKPVERIGTRPEDKAQFAQPGSKIEVLTVDKLVEKGYDPTKKIILDTNVTSHGNPVNRRQDSDDDQSCQGVVFLSGAIVMVPLILLRKSGNSCVSGKDELKETKFWLFDRERFESETLIGMMADTHELHVPSNPSTHESLEEMDFTRGMWQPAMEGDISRVEVLLSKGTSPNVTDLSGYTPLHYAARQGHLQICTLLVQSGANLNAQTKAGGATALHRAALAGHENIVKELMRAGADPYLVDEDGRTALHRAVEGQSEKVIRCLLSSCPKLARIRDKRGLTPEAHPSAPPRIINLFYENQK